MAICPIIAYYLTRALMHDVACEFETISANGLKVTP